MMDRFNIEILKKHDACQPQIELFTKQFPDGAPLTVEAALSVSTVFDWNWAAKNLLTALNRDAYRAATKPALEAYDASLKAALEAYNASIKAALEAYNASLKADDDAHEAAMKPARDAYEAARDTAFDAYSAATKPLINNGCDVRAKAFAELYISQNT